MVSSRNLTKYHKIIDNGFALAKNNDELIQALGKAGAFIRGSVSSKFLEENKCSIRDVKIFHEYEWNGHKLWWCSSWTLNRFTLKSPIYKTGQPYDWGHESNFLSQVYKDINLKSNLIPKDVEFVADIHGKIESWIYSPAEASLLGVEPCLTKVEKLENK